MRKLLADEMSKEMEAKRRSPSVVARLMGLDGLPSPRHGHRQQKRLSSNHQQKPLSKVVQKDDHLFDRHTSKRRSLDHKEFKDVYEDLEASHVATQHNPSKRISKLKKPEIHYLEQKLPISRPCNRDENLNSSAGLTGNIGSANLNDELLLKFRMNQDSLGVKHLQCNPSSSQHSHIAILKPLNSEKHESSAKAWNSMGECPCKKDGRSRRSRKDGLLLNPLNHQSSAKSPLVQSYESHVKHKLPMQIVVLKPRKSGDTMPSVLSPGFSHSYAAHSRHPSAENFGAAPRATSAFSEFQGISKPKCREAREIAKKITGQIKETIASFDSRPISSKYSKERGYAGDESSNDVCDSDSDCMSDIMAIKRGNLFGRNNQSRGSAMSSLTREAKKRLTEKWKMTNKYQSEETIAKGNTLGEMLELPEEKRSPGKLDVCNRKGDRTVGLASNNILCVWNGPSGISSKDGWTQNQAMSRSTASALGSKNRNRSGQRARPRARHVLTQDTMNHCKGSSTVDGNISCIEGFSPKALRSSGKEHLSCQDKYVVNVESIPGTTCTLSKTKEKLELSEEHIMGSSDPESVVRLIPDMEGSEHDIRDTFVCDQEDSILQETSLVISEEGPAPEPETSECFSEAEDLSPISVLETASSSSGCEGFGSVFDGLQELRKQLQLLKMDSTEESIIVANNDDYLLQIEEDHMLSTESWEDQYIVDLLSNSGLEKLHLHAFNAQWQSLQIPIGASVFDTLEKKYCHGKTQRSDRKLLFDRINSELPKIFLQDIDSCNPVKPSSRNFDTNWQNHGLKDELKTLLASKEKGTEASTPMKILDIETEWSSYRDGICMIGKDIEKILTDELIMDIVSLYS
ncbi:hypothetical protein Leryth_007537 [Lithospermum erythrorhizon]|nr:hypothetical protein Leryth_007537 [Lithospermum erythrorhizon]